MDLQALAEIRLSASYRSSKTIAGILYNNVFPFFLAVIEPTHPRPRPRPQPRPLPKPKPRPRPKPGPG